MIGAVFELVTRAGHPDFLDLPFDEPLADWSIPELCEVARGISRHVVRFVDMGGSVYALKEIPEHLATHEYDLLRKLEDRGLPVVEAVGVVTRDQLNAILITRHLAYSLPYRYLFRGRPSPVLRARLLDAMALLMVRLHLEGFFWGDCSLSNTLFRRDAGALTAHLVDAETGRLGDQISDGQRGWDLEIATENCAGELLDLHAGGRIRDEIDPLEILEQFTSRYESLWVDLNSAEVFAPGDRYRINARLQRLNELGFDIEEYSIRPAGDGNRLKLIPRIVEVGHHRRQLQQLTGLEVGENQARRLLNDIESRRAEMEAQNANGKRVPDALVAYHWLTDVYAPTIEAVPAEFRNRLDDAEIYHQILEHRWYLSESAGHDVGLDLATASYVDTVLAHRPEEVALLPAPDDTGSLSTDHGSIDHTGLSIAP